MSSSSPAPTSTASRWRWRPRRRESPRGTSSTPTRHGSASWPGASTGPTTSSSAPPTPSTWRRCRRSSSGCTTTATSTRALYEGWYCPRCADFKSEAERGPDNTCPIHEIPLLWESQQNWFFRLSAFQEPLERLYAERPDFVRPDFRRNEALSFIRSGLQDVSLSRPKLSWGVPVPWDPEQVIYVWWDALLNYYTALSYARDGEDLTERYWPASLHIIAKDILKFHTVYWPAFLLAAGDRAAGARLRPRLPADGGEEDVEVARQRARAERGDRALRARRAALLLHARGLVRPGRQRLGRGLRVALRDRARQRLGQPRLPHAGDDRALPRRRRSRGGARPRPGRGRRRARGHRRAGARPARRGRAHAGAGGDLGPGAAAQPLRRGVAAVGPGQGRVAERSPRSGALQPGRGRAGARAAAGGLHARHQRRRP